MQDDAALEGSARMAQQSVQELQRDAVTRMIGGSGGSEGGDQHQGGWDGGRSQTWKVLVYDKFCQEVIAPLLRVGGLRDLGVTLHLNLNSDRLAVADAPAVYFVEPTRANIQRILEDLGKNLYESCYVNFASSVPHSLLEELARGSLKAGAAHRVVGVFDRYVSFVSLSPSLFTLNLPAAYETLHSPSLADDVIQQYVERIVDGLLSVLVTARALPVIRCPPGEVAEMVSMRLQERIRELLGRGGAGAPDLFSAPSSRGGPPAVDGGPGGAGATQRPILCILDRDVDLVTMLHHSWTYQSLAHDVFAMKLNRLTVPVESPGGDSSAPPKPRSYDVDEGDGFWTTHAGEPFPNVAQAVHEAIEEYNKKMASMREKDEGDPNDPGLAAAINALPEMTEKKRSIDMHTNIATALLTEIKERELDRYYEMEDLFASQSLATSITQCEQLLASDRKGTMLDKTRAMMVLYLSKPSISSAQLRGLGEALRNAGGEASGLDYLQHLASIRNMAVPSLVAGPGSSAPSGGASLMGNLTSAMGAIGKLGDGMFRGGEGLLAAGMSNIRNIVASKKDSAVCQIVDALMEQKGTALTENYLYLDPKAPASGGEVPRIRAPFRRGIAFVIGGGNYTEMQVLQEWAQAHGRSVSYGSTDMVSPAQFVEELSHLGQAQQGGGGTDLR